MRVVPPGQHDIRAPVPRRGPTAAGRRARPLEQVRRRAVDRTGPVARHNHALSASARGYGVAHRRARLVVLERDRYRCQWCGAPANEADHLGAKLPDPSTMVAACRSCNARRGVRRANERRRRRPSRQW